MIEFKQPGQFTTIQDLGRYGYRAMGVPVSGPMDRASASFANQLLGNDLTDSIIEMSLTGATLYFHKSAIITITGADCKVTVDSEIIELNRVVKIEANSTLKCGQISSGNYLYLAILGGIISKNILGSACYYGGLTEKSRIEKGQKLHFNNEIQTYKSHGAVVKRAPKEQDEFIQVEKGPEFHQLSVSDIQRLTESFFSVSRQSNRMGLRLENQVSIDIKEIISSPVQPGTVQLTSGGQLIVLMRDAQTTGGYSRVFQLTPSGINILAQKPFDEPFKFQLVD